MAEIFGIEDALTLFEREHGRRPTAEEGIAALVPDQLDKIPIDPWWNPYVYVPHADRGYVVSYGADGKTGGEGAAADISRDDLFGERSTNERMQLVAIPASIATALLFGSALIVPLVAYVATDRPLWAVGVLAGASACFALLASVIGLVVMSDAGLRSVPLLLIGVMFAAGSISVLLRVRYSDGAVMTALAVLLGGLWMLSGMIVR